MQSDIENGLLLPVFSCNPATERRNGPQRFGTGIVAETPIHDIYTEKEEKACGLCSMKSPPVSG